MAFIFIQLRFLKLNENVIISTQSQLLDRNTSKRYICDIIFLYKWDDDHIQISYYI